MFLPRKNDTLFLHQHDKQISIQFEDFDEVMAQTKKWHTDWQKTNKPISLEDFIVAHESFLIRQYGDAQVELAKTYVLLSGVFQLALSTAAQRPEMLHKLFKAVNEFS